MRLGVRASPLSRAARSSGDHSSHSSAVSFRKICSRVSKYRSRADLCMAIASAISVSVISRIPRSAPRLRAASRMDRSRRLFASLERARSNPVTGMPILYRNGVAIITQWCFTKPMHDISWFITGSSRGFGRELTVAALEAGDRVAATARRPEQLADLIERFGDRLLVLPLDVTDPTAVGDALSQARDAFGRLDVVVNNAGYANVSPIEATSDADFRMQFETNFWGVYNVSKAAIPILRAQGGGQIVQFSSVGGRVGGSPGIASYQAAKFAVDGFTRVLAAETAPFNIKTMVVEPSGFATDWAGSSMTVHDIPAAYDSTIGGMH